MKTLIQIDEFIWGKLKKYATINELSLSSSIERILSAELNRFEQSELRNVRKLEG